MISGLTKGAAQVAEDGIGLVQGEVSILELGKLPEQLEGDTALSEVLRWAAPTSVPPDPPHKADPPPPRGT